MIDTTEFDKDQLAEYAFNTFQVELDMRKGMDKLKAEVVKLQTKPVAEIVVAPVNPAATHILNLATGQHFPWTEALASYLKNSAPCDEFGNKV